MSSRIKSAAVTAAVQQFKRATPVSSEAVLMKKVLPSGFTSLWCAWGNPEKPSCHVLTGETMISDLLPIVEMASVSHFNPSFPDLENKVKMMEDEGFERVGLVEVLHVEKRWYVRLRRQWSITVPADLDFRA